MQLGDWTWDLVLHPSTEGVVVGGRLGNETGEFGDVGGRAAGAVAVGGARTGAVATGST
jgi:hypothetical protein